MLSVIARTVVLALCLVVSLAAGLPARAADYPTKPVTLVIPYPPGGSTDLTARALAEGAKGPLGQPIICENKGGGGGTVGPSLVVSRPPDGYTIGVSTGATMNAWHMGKLNFNPLTDNTPIIRYSAFVYGLVVRTDSPWKSVQDMVKYAKENPGKVSFGTSGVGTNPHLAIEELSLLAGIKLSHVPFKGGAEAGTALLGGHVDMVSDSTSWAPLVDAGKLRLLATYGTQRMPRYPNAPTLREAGYDIVQSSPLHLIGPKGMPTPVVQKLHDAFKKAMTTAEFQSVLKKFDMSEIYLGPEDLEKALRQESDQIGTIVKKLGLR